METVRKMEGILEGDQMDDLEQEGAGKVATVRVCHECYGYTII